MKLLNVINPLKPELNPSAQRCLPRFLLGILIFKGLTARRLYKLFGVKGLIFLYTGNKLQWRRQGKVSDHSSNPFPAPLSNHSYENMHLELVKI
jgi:hypothetical protein